MDIDNIIILAHTPKHIVTSETFCLNEARVQHISYPQLQWEAGNNDVLSVPLTCNMVASSRSLSFWISAQQSRNMEGGIHDIW